MRTGSLRDWMKTERPDLGSELIARVELCKMAIAQLEFTKSAHDIRIVGSTARGWFSAGSDVDLIVLADEHQEDLDVSSSGLEIGASFIQIEDVEIFLQKDVCNASELRLAANLEVGLILKESQKFSKSLTDTNSQKVPDERLLVWYLKKASIWLNELSDAKDDDNFSLLSNRILQSYIFVALLASKTRLLKHKWNLVSLRFENPDLFFIVARCYTMISPENPKLALVEFFQKYRDLGLIDAFHQRAFTEAVLDWKLVRMEDWMPTETAAYLCSVCLFSMIDSVKKSDNDVRLPVPVPKLTNVCRRELTSYLNEARALTIQMALQGCQPKDRIHDAV